MKAISLLFLLLVVQLVHGGSKGVAFDFGNEWLKVAVMDSDAYQLIDIVVNEVANRKSPSVVGIQRDDILFGDEALTLWTKSPQKSFVHFKELIGLSYDDPLVSKYTSELPFYNLHKSTRNTVEFQAPPNTLDISQLSVEEISALLLHHGHKMAREFTNDPLETCITTVPDYYSQEQRELARQILTLAGCSEPHVISNSIAVAIDYSRNLVEGKTENVLFLESGSQGASAALVNMQKHKNQVEIKLVQLEYDPSIGGFDLDLRLLDHLIAVADKQFKLSGTSSIRNSPKSVAKLLNEIKTLKEDLSAGQKMTLRLEEFYEGQDFVVTVTRKEFEDLTQDIYEKFNAIVKKINNKVDSIELYGGAQRVPMAVSSLKTMLGDKPPVGRHIDGEESPVQGAAYYLASLKGVAKVPKINVVEIMSGGKGKIIGEKEYSEYNSRIQNIMRVQQAKEESIAAKNKLESLIVDLREQLSDEKSLTELNEVAEWIEEFDNLPAAKYLEKFEDLQRLLEIKDEL